MAWVRIDDGFPEHRKVVAVGPLGMAMQVAGICYCNRNLTDGFIPWAAARTLLTWEFLGEQGEQGAKRYTIAVTCGMQGDDVTTEFVIGLLLEAGIWEEVEGGYQIHDYDEYQPTKAEVLALQEERREAGRRGGLASVEAKRQAKLKQTSSKCSSKTEAKFNPNPNPNPNDLEEGDPTTPTPSSGMTELCAFIADYIDGGAQPHISQMILSYVDEGMEPGCVKRALEIAAENGVRKPKYVMTILNGWLDAHICTRGQAIASEKAREKFKKQGRAPPSTPVVIDTPEQQAKTEELRREIAELVEAKSVEAL